MKIVMRTVGGLLGCVLVVVPIAVFAEPLPRSIYYVLDQRIWRVQPDGTGRTQLPIAYGTADALAVSPAAGKFAFVDKAQAPARVCVATDDEVSCRIALPRELDLVESLRWSPGGDRLVLHNAGRSGPASDGVYLLDPQQGTIEPLTPKDAHDMDPSWSPDGKSIAVIAVTSSWTDDRRSSDVVEMYWEGAVEIVDLETRNRRRVAGPSERLHGAAWSPDGKSIAYASITDVYVVAAAGGVPRSVLRGNVMHGPLWSPDGKRLLVTLPGPDLKGPDLTRSTRVVVIEATGTNRKEFSIEAEVQDIAFGPDGKELALVYEFDRLVRMATDGSLPTTLTRRASQETGDLLPILTEVAWAPRH